MDDSSARWWWNGVCELGNADLENAVRQANCRDRLAGIARKRHLFAKPPAVGCLDVQHGGFDTDGELVRADGARSDGDKDFAGLIEYVDQMPVGAVDLGLCNGGLTPDR